MNILDQINSSADVKALAPELLQELCAELREEIIRDVSQTGGHLASSLGAVELTVALHRVYDTSTDRVLFDVGHQCYAHKLITGRRAQFHTLRQLDGIAGFPKPREAADDPCIVGHASTSISLALGMARARRLLGADYEVAAVIGDGALTGGVAYEGLSDCGESGEPIVIILNDNEMSIHENVGGMAHLLGKIRLRPSYILIKHIYHRTLGRNERIYRLIHRAKERLKNIVLPDNMFEDMGFYYLGPVDGHDVLNLTRIIRYARDLRQPAIVHVCTRKGKGYPPAEQNPTAYHGVSPFDPAVGIVPQSTETARTFSDCFGRTLCEYAAQDDKIVAITAAMCDGTGLNDFAQRYPARLFDVAIAEQHAAAMAAGMARQGLKPVFAVYSTFLQRAYDMLMNDIALSGEHVVLAVDHAGLVGADGETHQGSFDVGYLCQTPGMAVWSPSNFAELRTMLRLALDAEGPAAVRYPRGGEGKFQTDTAALSAALLRHGTDVTLVSYGILINEALGAAELLAARSVSAEVIKLNRLDTPDFEMVTASVARTGRLIVAEETAEAGCIGTRLLAALEERGVPAARSAILRNLDSGVVQHGTVAQLWNRLHLDAAGLAAAYEEFGR